MGSSLSLKWCKKNLERYCHSVQTVLGEEHPEVDMEIQDCVNLCGLCTDVPFALRNNAVVSARDARGLYVKLEKGFQFTTAQPLPGTFAAVALQAKHTSSETESDI